MDPTFWARLQVYGHDLNKAALKKGWKPPPAVSLYTIFCKQATTTTLFEGFEAVASNYHHRK